MALSDLIEKVTDPYERQARLWPGLLSIFPLLAVVGFLYAHLMTVLSGILTLAGSCGILYLLSNIARERGKRLEVKLFEQWGGKPSTQLLRHSNPIIEEVTKRRYHAFLSSKIGEKFPKKEEEERSPQVADDIYQSGVRWLLNQTRNTDTFALLFKENISYGFRRNAFGLKPFGLFASIVSILWILSSQQVLLLSAPCWFNGNAFASFTSTAIILLILSVLMLIIWVFFFTKNIVKSAAFTYAETLLRACDALDTK